MSQLGKKLIAAASMSREDIIAACKQGAERAAAPGFAQSPPNQKHVERFEELVARAKLLVEGVEVDLDAPIEGDVAI